MQIIMLCLFVVAILCLVQGLRKSSFGQGQVGGPKQHCALCGWTKEKVQLYQLKQNHTTKITTLCFDCSMKHDAMPVRGTSAGTSRTTACV
jgi:hypothetical protein